MSQPWMKFYPGDYLRDTRDLSPAEHGCYLLLIMHYWTTGGIPRDHERLARIVGADATEWATQWSTAVLSFFDEVDGQWRHGRIDDELAKAAEKHEKLVTSSRKGVEARLSGKPIDQPNGQPNGQPTPEPEPDKKKDSCASDEKFEEFWKEYPKRAGANPKDPALKLFRGYVKSGVDPDQIVFGARQCRAADADKVGTQYIPQAVKWLRDKRWRDYAELATATPEARKGIYVEFSDPARDAWDAYGRANNIKYPVDKRGGWEFPTRWPPGYGESDARHPDADQSPRP